MKAAAGVLAFLLAAGLCSAAEPAKPQDLKFEEVLSELGARCASPGFDAPALFEDAGLRPFLAQALDQKAIQEFESLFACEARLSGGSKPCERLAGPGWERSYAACRREFAHAALVRDPRGPGAQALCLEYLTFSGAPIAAADRPAACRAYLEALPGKDFQKFCRELVSKEILPPAARADCVAANSRAAASSFAKTAACGPLQRRASASLCARYKAELGKTRVKREADLTRRVSGETPQELAKRAASREAVQKMEKFETARSEKSSTQKQGWVKKEAGRRRFKSGQPMKGTRDLREMLERVKEVR
ncbi:MAG: hypothetical protein HY921_07630 [Elusimicrobia bacterium]|nr:hypothetical protein [Elusimicrobiota bacterium]